MAIRVQHQQPKTRRFTVDEYYKMAEVGILRPDERVQLIDGEIIEMPPIGPGHAGHVDLVAIAFNARLAGRVYVRTQNPVRLADGSEPEPDVALIRRSGDGPYPYVTRHPTSSDVLLLVEVSDTTLDFDLGRKARDYARHNILELWVLDVRGERLVVHRGPTLDGYAHVVELRRGETIAPLAFPHASIPVDQLLG